LWLVWFDGEEALRERWSAEDSLYGSRRLAAKWSQDGTARRIKALINVDMIGDSDLELVQEMSSTARIRDLIWQTASKMGYARHFPASPGSIEDDHVPFLQRGIPAVDLIDFDYGLWNRYWHTDADTMDKLSPRSFQVVGDVLLQSIKTLEE
jgi:Zn-dependent M28 family amino/carboxypeptidase